MPPFTTPVGVPNLADAAIQYIHEVFVPELLIRFYADTVLSRIANTKYEGRIKAQGNKVTVRTAPDITSRRYNPHEDIIYQTPRPSFVEMPIDQARYIAIHADQIEMVQSDISYFEQWIEHGKEQMGVGVEGDCFQDIHTQVHAKNTGATAGAKTSRYNMGTVGTPRGLTKDNILKFITDCASVLTEQNIPKQNRWMVLPDWCINHLLNSDLIDASKMGDGTSALRTGSWGKLVHFDIYDSNLLYDVTDGANLVTHVMFGHKEGLSWATQFTDDGFIVPEHTFGKRYRLLQVYGYKVMVAEAVGLGYVYDSTA